MNSNYEKGSTVSNFFIIQSVKGRTSELSGRQKSEIKYDYLYN